MIKLFYSASEAKEAREEIHNYTRAVLEGLTYIKVSDKLLKNILSWRMEPIFDGQKVFTGKYKAVTATGRELAIVLYELQQIDLNMSLQIRQAGKTNSILKQEAKRVQAAVERDGYYEPFSDEKAMKFVLMYEDTNILQMTDEGILKLIDASIKRR